MSDINLDNQPDSVVNNDIDVIDGDDDEEEGAFDIQTSVDFEYLDKSVEDLGYNYRCGKLILQPDFQRQYVWDDKAATLFIDSLIRGIPIPNIFCCKTKDGKYEVIDGQQRLTTVLSFVHGSKLNNNGEFTKLSSQQMNGKFVCLSKSKEFNESIRGKKFSELTTEQQNKIKNTSIRVVVLKNLENNPDLKYDLFMRLNTGANKLNDMELRKCVFRSKYFSKLEELAKNETFKKLICLNEDKRCTKSKRMEDVKIVLQFACLRGDISGYAGSYKSFFNKLLEKEQQKCKERDYSDVEKIEKDFNNAVKCLYIIYGDKPIRKVFEEEALKAENKGRIPQGYVLRDDGYYVCVSKINIALINALLVGFCKYKPVDIQRKQNEIKQAIIDIQLNDKDFINSIIAPGSANKDKVFTRINKIRQLLKSILGEEERFFTPDLRKNLFEKSKQENNGVVKCQICGYEIHNIQDASVDHIVPYSKGGETTEQNAQLVHSWCNSSKGNKYE